jgi:cysteine synthase
MKDGSEKEFRSKVYNSIVDAIGATPLVRLGRLEVDVGVDAQILRKCKCFNPLSSVKGRIRLAMIETAGHGRQKHLRNPTPFRRALPVNGTV